MLNYHDTKKSSLFWINKIKWYVITSKAENKAIIYSNHLLYNNKATLT